LSAPIGSLSDPRAVRLARRLRFVCRCQEGGLYAIVAGSVFALASVRPWAYVPLWVASGGLALLLLERVAVVRALRGRVGPRRFSFHPTGFWLVLDDEAPYGMPTWSFDLARRAVPLGPLVIPGAALLALILVQLVPLPAPLVNLLSPRRAELSRVPAGSFVPLTVSEIDTRRGLAFAATIWLIHLVAGAVLDRSSAARRFRAFIAGLGAVLGLVALVQRASGTSRLLGLVPPIEYDGHSVAMGPFVNRNHFAGYLLMATCLALGLLMKHGTAYVQRAGTRTNPRRWLVNLQSEAGTAFLYSLLASVATVGALLAANSRGGLVAFVVALVAALMWPRAGGRGAVWLPLGIIAAVALGMLGLGQLAPRWQRLSQEAPGRVVVWRTSLQSMRGLWLTGSGFNTFASAVSRTSAWALPKGATPWADPEETSVTRNPQMAFFSPSGAPGLGWYREAHSDYLQLLIEVGVPGVLIALTGVALLLSFVREDPFLSAALLGVLLH
jgi:hypothetical protein